MAWPFNRKIETKENPVGAAFVVGSASSWTRNKDPMAYVLEGYQMNIVVYRAIREVVEAAKSISIEIYSGDDMIEQHPALDLLNKPNPRQSYGEWITEMLVNRMLFGETAAVAAGPQSTGKQAPPSEVWPLMPPDLRVLPGRFGLPSGFKYERGGVNQEFQSDPITGEGPVFFSKMYNPGNYWRGQSPLMAASIAGDTFNAGSKWNYSLLKNSARPSGLVRFKGGYPMGETIERMREYFKKAISGEQNAGEIPMLSDDAEWVPLSQSPRDMDFISTMKESAKYVASAFGVPLPLIDNDASTFNNVEQAKERLYTDTVIPMMNDFIGAYGAWLLPRYGDGLEFRLDLDSIPALEALRGRMFNRAVMAYEKGVLTREESREMMGFQPEGQGEFRSMGGPMDIPADDIKALAYGLDLEVKADRFKPPQTVVSNYRRGLKKHDEGLTGDGIERGTIKVARDIVAGESVTAEWVRKANRWWGRNERFLSEPEDSAAYASALLWGGAAGRDWYRARYNDLEGE